MTERDTMLATVGMYDCATGPPSIWAPNTNIVVLLRESVPLKSTLLALPENAQVKVGSVLQRAVMEQRYQPFAAREIAADAFVNVPVVCAATDTTPFATSNVASANPESGPSVSTIAR